MSAFQEPGTGLGEEKMNRPNCSVFSRDSQSSDELVNPLVWFFGMVYRCLLGLALLTRDDNMFEPKIRETGSCLGKKGDPPPQPFDGFPINIFWLRDHKVST